MIIILQSFCEHEKVLRTVPGTKKALYKCLLIFNSKNSGSVQWASSSKNDWLTVYSQ